MLAVNYENGEETGRFMLQTAGDVVMLSVSTDDRVLAAGGKDLAFLTVKLTDRNGLENLQAEKTVTVCVEGAGSLQGFGSGASKSERSYQDTEWETYDGEVMAVVRSGMEPGKINVTFKADGCEEKIIVIEVK